MKRLTASLAAMLAATAVHAAEWRTTWYAAPMPAWGAEFALPTMLPPALEAQTVREVVRTSVGGEQVRITYSNRYGAAPLVIGEARLAATRGEASRAASSQQDGSGVQLTFGGQRGVTIAPGQTATSDAASLPIAARQRLSISTWLPQRTALATFHWGAQQTAFVAPGNLAAATALPAAQAMTGRTFLSAVQVAGPARLAVVAFGDSITDGNGSTPDLDLRWPDQLAARADGVAVANAGISGARLLSDGMGEKAAARFEHDVLAQPGVGTVIVLLGINDIGWPGSAFAPQEAPATASAMIAGYRKLISAARARQVRIVGGTLLPFEGALHGTPYSGHYSPAKDKVRHEVNDWIRHSGEFDATIDFDQLLRDPAHPTRLRAGFDSGDHLHPSDAGYAEMARAAALVAK
ncbi:MULTISPECIES: SGNH/GDSL hydrolase family protein [unclassified Duganella]|uniref:SGNH/GDSL hydrolase family protein n=1 Tax=unclassified Duganella TaxID=2636909 RepID=UPI0006FDA484|nr:MULTISPECIES: SGNH/GDSL hydrolase family protein [unclassified Duganella]KQV51060.1 lipase [Duganella sp. Root336D2]KRC00641.1 lipase [Duganella sp. Root198D2]